MKPARPPMNHTGDLMETKMSKFADVALGRGGANLPGAQGPTAPWP
jgi:hypothetical protein